MAVVTSTVILATAAAQAGTDQQDYCAGSNILQQTSHTDLAMMQAEADRTINGHNLLWRIKSNDDRHSHHPPSYMFGTFHSVDPHISNPPEIVTKYLRESRVLMVEITSKDQQEMQQAIAGDPSMFMDPSGGTTALLGTEADNVYGALSATYGIPPQILANMQPWYLQLLLSLPACEVKAQAQGLVPLDRNLELMAQQHGLPVEGMESWQTVLALFQNGTLEDKRETLILGAALLPYANDLMITSRDLYLQQNVMMIPELQKLLERNLGYDSTATMLDEAFWQQAIVDRNIGFAKAVHHHISHGGAFIAVGALHLPGEQGMVELIRAQGFIVEPVTLH